MKKSMFSGLVEFTVRINGHNQPELLASIIEPLTVNGISVSGYYNLSLVPGCTHYQHHPSLKRAGTFISLPWETKAYGKIKDAFIAEADNLLHDEAEILRAHVALLERQASRAKHLAQEHEADAVKEWAEHNRLSAEVQALRESMRKIVLS